MNLKRVLFLTALTVLLGFGGGFFMGRANDKKLTDWGLKPPRLRILVEKPELFPLQMKELLELETGIRLEVQNFENEKSLTEMVKYFDIFLGSNCLIERVQMDSEDLHDLPSVTRNISPDFITITQKQSSVIPLLWKFSKEQGFEIVSLRVKRASNTQSMDLLEAWLKKDFMERWSHDSSMSNTFMTLDESSLAPELKASWLRTIPLTSLSLLHQINCGTAAR